MVKSLPANAGDIRKASLILRSGRSPGEGHNNPSQYFHLENWNIPWIEEPSGLQTIGPQKVRHD